MYIVLLNSFSIMILAIGCWILLFTLCQSKHIEVNNKGNDSSSCCIEGTCLCGSLYEALLNVENDTVINITSSLVILHNATHMETKNNITIISNGATVTCNDSGSLDCLYCSNVIIKGITWDQCGDPNHPHIHYAIGFGITINVSIIACIFQYSKVCIVVAVYQLSSGILQVHNSRFLFNHIVNLSQCTGAGLYATLLINDGEYRGIQNSHVSIRGTLFYHNAVPYVQQDNDIITSGTLFCAFSLP